MRRDGSAHSRKNIRWREIGADVLLDYTSSCLNSGFVFLLIILFQHAISCHFSLPFPSFFVIKDHKLDAHSACSCTVKVHILHIQWLDGAGWAYKQHRGDAEESHIAAPPTLGSVLACLMLQVCVGGYGMPRIRLYVDSERQCSTLFFSPSPDCLRRDSLEVIHGSAHAITWPMA